MMLRRVVLRPCALAGDVISASTLGFVGDIACCQKLEQRFAASSSASSEDPLDLDMRRLGSLVERSDGDLPCGRLRAES